MENKEFKPDSIVQAIIDRFTQRAKFGFDKYQTTLDRTDLTPEQWAQHAIEESHDHLLYLEKWKREQKKQARLLELLIKGTTEATTLWLSEEELKEYKQLRIEFYERTNN